MSRTPQPWSSGLISNPKSPRPNVIIWSNTTAKSMGVAVARDVSTSDAPVICAAYDLLEALESLLASPHVSKARFLEPKVTAARAAVAKARGKP